MAGDSFPGRGVPAPRPSGRLRALRLLVISGLAGALFAASPPDAAGPAPPVTARPAVTVPESAWRRLRGEVEAVPRPRGLVASVFVMDLQTGQSFGLDADRPMPAASLIKLPIAVALEAAVIAEEVAPDETLVLERRHKAGGSGDLRRRRTGAGYDPGTLVAMMLQRSDNTAANILTERLGLASVNGSCRTLHLEGTRMERYVMDLAARARDRENWTTAADMGRLLAGLYYGTVLDEAACRRLLETLKGQRIRDRLPRHLPRSTVVAHKTGFMNDAVHDAGIIYGRNHHYVVCVLTTPRYPYFRSAKEYIGRVARVVYRYDRFVKARERGGASSFSPPEGYNESAVTAAGGRM